MNITLVHTRFLVPFRFDSRALGNLERALDKSAIWNRRQPNSLLQDEYLPSFLKSQFGSGDEWKYYQVPVELAQKWLGSDAFDVAYTSGSAAACRIAQAKLMPNDGRAIELFLIPDGAGALSVTIAAEAETTAAISLDDVKSFNYSLSQREESTHRKFRGALLRKRTNPHAPAAKPGADEIEAAGRWAKPSGGAEWLPLGGLCRYLLGPLQEKEFGFAELHSQIPLMPYSVVRMPISTSLSTLRRPPGVTPADDLVGQASLLAQVDEAAHPLPVEEDPGVVAAILHTDEMVAVSSMGLAFMVCDAGTGFDKTKHVNRRDKYFTAFLAALFQRLVLTRLVLEAGELAALEAGKERSWRLSELRNKTLAYVAAAHFTEVSARDVVNRFYRLCQQAHRVPETLALVQRTIADLDAAVQAEAQTHSLTSIEDLGRKQTTALRVMASTQNKVEWIEIFIISFYSAELIELFGKQFGIDHLITGATALAAMVAAGCVAALMIRPWHMEHVEEDAKPEPRHKPKMPRSFIRTAILLPLAILALLLVGRHFFPMHENEELKQLRQEVQQLQRQLAAPR